MMPQSSASSTPISIPMSSPIAINNRRDSFSDDEDGDRIIGGHRTSLYNSESIEELRVGSLPGYLRRPGRNANPNGNMKQYHRNYNSGQQQQQHSQQQQFMGPMSLPPPKAPFLSSRQDIDSKLSTMPEMALPESAASVDPDLSSSVPFGSLRESKFAHPHFDRWQQKSNSNQEATTTQFQPHSLPAYSGGIGAYFPDPNNANTVTNTSNELSGIGGLLEGDNNNYSRDVAGITDEYSQLTLENTSFDNGRPNHTINDENLSSSLTALDMMTRIRQTAPLTLQSQFDTSQPNNAENPRITRLMENNSFHQHEQNEQQLQYSAVQQPLTRHLGENTAGGNTDDPDTFGAFDFELDE